MKWQNSSQSNQYFQNPNQFDVLLLPNLYGDTAWVPLASTVQAIKECGADKIMFGTDNTIDGVDTLGVNPSGERSLYQQYFNELKELITPQEYEKLMYKNSIKVFKLERFFNV